jgi:hypothetical protein
VSERHRRWQPAWLVATVAYVATVGAAATLGFVTHVTGPVLVAAALALPSSLIALAAYYVSYGLLAQIPGANVSESTGAGSCSLHGVCQGATTGDTASWFIHTTELIGIFALAAAAVLNVVALWFLLPLGRSVSTPRPPPGESRPSGAPTQ